MRCRAIDVAALLWMWAEGYIRGSSWRVSYCCLVGVGTNEPAAAGKRSQKLWCPSTRHAQATGLQTPCMWRFAELLQLLRRSSCRRSASEQAGEVDPNRPLPPTRCHPVFTGPAKKRKQQKTAYQNKLPMPTVNMNTDTLAATWVSSACRSRPTI